MGSSLVAYGEKILVLFEVVPFNSKPGHSYIFRHILSLFLYVEELCHFMLTGEDFFCYECFY